MDGGKGEPRSEPSGEPKEVKAQDRSREHRKMMQRQGLEETRQYTMAFDPQEKRLVAKDRESASVHNIWLKEGGHEPVR